MADRYCCMEHGCYFPVHPWYFSRLRRSIPAAWDGLTATRQFRGATYDIKVSNPSHVNKGIKSVTVDGNAIEGNVIPAFGDGKTHTVEVVMG